MRKKPNKKKIFNLYNEGVGYKVDLHVKTVVLYSVCCTGSVENKFWIIYGECKFSYSNGEVEYDSVDVSLVL